MLRTTVALALTMFALASYAGAGGPLPDTERAKIEAEIRAAMQGFEAAASAVDPDKTFAYFSSSPDFRAVDNESIVTSRDTVLARYRELYAELQSQERKTTEGHLSVLSRDLAIYTARGTFALTYKSGKTTPPSPLAWTLLWRREGGEWKVINAHQSFVPPPRP